MLKIITSCHYNRPSCTQEFIEHLYKCDRGSEYTYLFFVEPGCQEVLDLINDFKFKKQVKINDNLLGLWANKKQAIDTGFSTGCDFLIHLEDDVLLGKDALIYFEWAANQYYSDNSVFNVTAYNKVRFDEFAGYGNDSAIVLRRNWYNSTAWGIWRRSYDTLVSQGWDGEDKKIIIPNHKAKGLTEVFPLLSRANNIGHINGKTSASHGVVEALEGMRGNTYKYTGNLALIQNGKGQEYVKLAENLVKSRSNDEYKQQYFLDLWVSTIEDVNSNFYERVINGLD
jgi:hypothetical protein